MPPAKSKTAPAKKGGGPKPTPKQPDAAAVKTEKKEESSKKAVEIAMPPAPLQKVTPNKQGDAQEESAIQLSALSKQQKKRRWSSPLADAGSKDPWYQVTGSALTEILEPRGVPVGNR